MPTCAGASKSLGIGPAARMSRSGEWGGEPELLMLSKALQRPIEVRAGVV